MPFNIHISLLPQAQLEQNSFSLNMVVLEMYTHSYIPRLFYHSCLGCCPVSGDYPTINVDRNRE